MTDERIGRQMAVVDARLREAVARLLREDDVGVLAASLALAGLAAELTVDFALSQGVDDADAALELVIRFLREQGRARAELHRVAAMEPKGRA